MAKNKSFSIDESLAFSMINSLEDEQNEKPKKNKPSKEDISSKEAVEDSKENNSQDRDAINNQKNEEPKIEINYDEVKPEVKEKAPEQPKILKKTSVVISRSSLNYLSVLSKFTEKTQNEVIADLISTDIEVNGIGKPDFTKITSRQERTDVLTKAIIIPEDVLKKGKKKAAILLQSFSIYVDNLIIDHMNTQDLF